MLSSICSLRDQIQNYDDILYIFLINMIIKRDPVFCIAVRSAVISVLEL